MRILLALTLLLGAGMALAEDADEAALALADQTRTEAKPSSDWRAFTEATLIQSTPRGDAATSHTQRLSADVLYDAKLAPQWRAVFADRLDLAWRGEPTYDDFVNTLKEAYVSWQPQPDRIVDAGRVNLRNGVAVGYNPTDYFRAGAVRSVVSIAPASLRENRLGTVMLRGQALWSRGSASALYAPKLADEPNNSPFSADFGATNNQDRWLMTLTQRWGENFSPQWLLYDDERNHPQLGLNLTALLTNATVGYLEWSGGRSPSLAAQALALPDDTEFRSRVATGLTYTTSNKITLTLEYQYNGAALDKDDWDALRRGPVPPFLQYRNFALNLQDPPTQDNLFWFALWQDALIFHLDLSAFQRLNLADHSRLSFVEGRYHWEKVDLALQWQGTHGDPASEFGTLPQQQVWQLVATYFF